MVTDNKENGAAAERWAAAVSAEGSYGQWRYVLAKKTTEVSELISKVAQESEPARV